MQGGTQILPILSGRTQILPILEGGRMCSDSTNPRKGHPDFAGKIFLKKPPPLTPPPRTERSLIQHLLKNAMKPQHEAVKKRFRFKIQKRFV